MSHFNVSVNRVLLSRCKHLLQPPGHTLVKACQMSSPNCYILAPLKVTSTYISIHKRKLSTSCRVHSSDDKYKSDPDVKGFLREISDDFEKKENVKSVNKTESNKKEHVGDIKSDDKKATGESSEVFTSKKKDLEDLLSELYASAEEEKKSSDTMITSSLDGYSSFKDVDAEVIYDVDEERRLQQELGRAPGMDKKKVTFKYEELAQRRGDRGVFNLDELVKVVKDEKVEDLAVIKIPKEKKYAEYLLIGTGRNNKHIYVTSQVIRKLYKRKKNQADFHPQIEGTRDKGNSGWIAMDLGNLVLHLFVQEQRDYYNLESLWTLGPEFDDLAMSTEQDPLITLESLMTDHLDPEFQAPPENAFIELETVIETETLPNHEVKTAQAEARPSQSFEQDPSEHLDKDFSLHNKVTQVRGTKDERKLA